MKKSKLISFCIIVLLFLPSIVYANSNSGINRNHYKRLKSYRDFDYLPAKVKNMNQ